MKPNDSDQNQTPESSVPEHWDDLYFDAPPVFPTPLPGYRLTGARDIPEPDREKWLQRGYFEIGRAAIPTCYEHDNDYLECLTSHLATQHDWPIGIPSNEQPFILMVELPEAILLGHPYLRPQPETNSGE